jgi:peroxiredoxin family protein
MSKPLAVFLHSSRYDRVSQAANLLLTASGMGRPCYLFLFYEALATFLDGSWDDTESIGGHSDGAPVWARELQRGIDLSGMPAPYEVLRMAASQPGGLKVCACSTSTRLLGREPDDVREKVDEIIGMAAMLELVADGEMIYI